jgi:hypothetical protein
MDISYADISEADYTEGRPMAPLAVFKFDNIGGSDEPVRAITLVTKNEFDSMIDGSSILGNVYAVDDFGNTLAFAPYPSGSVMNMIFVSPLNVPLQQSRNITLYADIKPASGPAKIKIGMQDGTGIDADVPVSAAPGYVFPMMTKAVEIMKLTTILTVSGYDLMPATVSTGQKNVYGYLAIITGPISSQYSASLITGVTVTVRDETGALIQANRAIASLTLRDAAGVFYATSVIPSSPYIYCSLQQPVTVTAMSSRNIYAVIDITGNTSNRASGVKLEFTDSQAFAARDYDYAAPVTLSLAPGFAYPLDSSAALILNHSSGLNISGAGTAPVFVSTNQQGVGALKLVLTNTGNTMTASAMATLMNFYVRDSSGTTLNPALFITSIKVTSPDGNVVYGSASSFTGTKVAVNLTAPVIISGASSVTLAVKADITAAYNPAQFKITLDSGGDIYAVDSNIFQPIAITGSFPASSGLMSMKTALAAVNAVNFTQLLPAAAPKGAKNAPVLAFDIVNTGGATGADAEFSGFTVYAQDSLLAYMSMSNVFDNLRVIDSSGLTVASAVSGVGSISDMVFAAPYIIPQGSARRVTLYADISAMAAAPIFNVSIAGEADLWVRDANSKVEAAKNALPVMPWEAGPCTVSTAPAANLSVWHDGTFAPLQVGAGQPNVIFMAVSFYNDGFTGASSIQLDGVTMTAIDGAGTGLNMASIFSGLRVINPGGTITYSSVDVSALASPSAYLPFTTPLVIPAGNTSTVYIPADISAAPSYTAFRLRVETPARIISHGVPSGVITVSSGLGDTFPMDSNLSAVSSMAYTLQLGHDNLMPVSVPIGTSGIDALRLNLSNANSTALSVTMVAVSVKSLSGALIPSDSVITNMYIKDANGVTLASQASSSSGRLAFTLPSFTVAASGVQSLVISVDISPSASGSFYMEIVSPSDVLTNPPSITAPAPGDYFGNIKSSAPAIIKKSLELSFHGFPNPFNPDKEKLTTEYYLENASGVSITFYTIYGRLVKKLLDNAPKTAGLHTEDVWDGRNAANYTVNSGVFICVIEAKEQSTGIKKKLVNKIAVLR